MSLSLIHTRANTGTLALPVEVEVHLSRGLPGFSIVGLPETAVKESKERVRSAIINSRLQFPASRIIVNLAPADLPKEGVCFDLAIALGILAASKQIPSDELDLYEFAGELALSGELRAFKGALPFALAAKKQARHIIIPKANLSEALLAGKSLGLYAAQYLTQVCGHLLRHQRLSNQSNDVVSQPFVATKDLSDVKGQAVGRRALEIAAAGGHSLLLVGPPGTGKSMLAKRLISILPPLNLEDAQEVASVYSISRQGFDFERWKARPFRDPHHSASCAALVGGGRPPTPGEISLAHQGVLFLDELPQFNRQALETLREPMEAKKISISRVSHQVEFPAFFQLIAAMNPCPCGYLGDLGGECTCTYEQVQRYQARISGPFLDRIDLHVALRPLSPALILNAGNTHSESSAAIQQRVIQARSHQMRRSKKLNVTLSNSEINKACQIEQSTYAFLEKAIKAFDLSARGYFRLLKVSRTIADLGGAEVVAIAHLKEALMFKSDFKSKRR